MTTAPKPSARQRSLRQLRNIGLIAAAVAVGLALFGIVSRYVSESRLSDKTTVEAVPTVAVIRPQRGVTNQELTLPEGRPPPTKARMSRLAGATCHWEALALCSAAT